MNVYLKNEYGQQTVRYLNFFKAIGLRVYVFARYPKSKRPIVRFVIWKKMLDKSQKLMYNIDIERKGDLNGKDG